MDRLLVAGADGALVRAFLLLALRIVPK